jgi:hypothetical protein
MTDTSTGASADAPSAPVAGQEIGSIRLALAAASQANYAAAAMIDYAMDGDAQLTAGGFEEDTVERIADAAKLAIEADEALGITDELRGQLHAALCRFLEGWAG